MKAADMCNNIDGDRGLGYGVSYSEFFHFLPSVIDPLFAVQASENLAARSSERAFLCCSRNRTADIVFCGNDDHVYCDSMHEA